MIHRTRLIPTLAVLAGLAGGSGGAAAQPTFADEVPEEFEGVGITDRTGESISLDTEFVNEDGETVRLERYFEDGKPVLLTLNYFRCPMLCINTLNSLIDTLNDIDERAGRDFTLLTVSFAADEGPDLAAAKKRNYLTRYEKEGAAEGWHFVTGSAESIQTLCDEVGFGFRFDPRSGEYAHSASVIYLTPKGRISLYMNDILFEPRDVELALVEASEGKIGSAVDDFLLLTCFQYDPDAGSYTPSAFKLMRFGGFLTILALGLAILYLRFRGPRHVEAASPNAELTGRADPDGEHHVHA